MNEQNAQDSWLKETMGLLSDLDAQLARKLTKKVELEEELEKLDWRINAAKSLLEHVRRTRNEPT